jgi:hypothetical protein
MLQIKLAAIWMMPLTLLCAIATAQQQPQSGSVKAPEPPPASAVPQGETAQTKDAASRSTLSAQLAPVNSSPRIVSSQGKVTDVAPANCDLWVVDKVYGPYVPYTGPPLKACFVPTEPTAPNSSSLNLTPTIELPADLVKSAAPAAPDSPIEPNAPTPLGASGSTSEYVRSVPVPSAVTGPLTEMKPFRTYAIGFKADTLGAGIEIATPLAGSFNLRSSFNFFAFDDPFSIDGVNYDARLHLQSSETVLDWFVGKNLHISPGFLYVKNSMSAPASVGPGQTFVLGSQTFINSVDDPVSGTSSVVFPRKFAPLLLLGYGNILPRSGRHLSFPFEIGVAYTGTPVIAVSLNGTACTTEGCVNFVSNQEAQTYLKQEVHNLNEDLKRYPVFPIVSLGVSYRF